VIEHEENRLRARVATRFTVTHATAPMLCARSGRRALFTGRELLELDDDGAVLGSPGLPCTALAVASSAEALYALGRTAHGASLWYSHSDPTWSEQTLPREVVEMAERGSLHLASVGQVVAVGTFRNGVAVSTDGGRSFRKIYGSSTCTALAATTYRGKPTLWAALYSELGAEACLIVIDATSGTAQSVADIGSRAGRDDGDGPRVHALAYDATTETVYAATEQGLFAFRPPR
jgi:hypothetical protein